VRRIGGHADAGGNFTDTSESYAFGESEELPGAFASCFGVVTTLPAPDQCDGRWNCRRRPADLVALASRDAAVAEVAQPLGPRARPPQFFATVATHPSSDRPFRGLLTKLAIA
jgi:hypothetical protein